MDLVYFVAVSLDGFIAPPDGSVAWLEPYNQTGHDHGYGAFYAGIDGLIEGRRTYELELGFGPWSHGNKPCWVHTRQAMPLASPQVRLTQAAPAAVIAEAEALGCRRLWMVGGGQVASLYQAAGLISEYIFSYIPVFLGAGIPLFAAPWPLRSLKLHRTETFPSGIVQAHYHRLS